MKQNATPPSQVTGSRTFREFFRFLLRASGLNELDYDGFCDQSQQHKAFFERMCALSSQKATKKPEECSDIDATAYLSSQEWSELELEFRALPKASSRV